MFPLSLLILPQFFFCIIQSKRKGLDVLVGVVIGVDIDVCAHALVAPLCLTLCDPMDSSLPGSFVWGILQARILEWVAMPSSRGSSWPRDWTQVSCVLLCRQTLYLLSHQEVHRHRWGPGRIRGRQGWPGLDISWTLLWPWIMAWSATEGGHQPSWGLPDRESTPSPLGRVHNTLLRGRQDSSQGVNTKLENLCSSSFSYFIDWVDNFIGCISKWWIQATGPADNQYFGEMYIPENQAGVTGYFFDK